MLIWAISATHSDVRPLYQLTQSEVKAGLAGGLSRGLERFTTGFLSVLTLALAYQRPKVEHLF